VARRRNVIKTSQGGSRQLLLQLEKAKKESNLGTFVRDTTGPTEV
jgi:hypothetical protein